MNKSSLFFLVAGVLFFSLTACFKDQEAQPPCTYDPCQYKAPAAEIAAVAAYLDSMGITGTTQHCSGLFYKVADSGTGVSPDPCLNSIVARYKGSLANGNVFDSGQFQRPVPLGGGLIAGWVNGLPLIKQGGRIMLYIPPSLGYGNQPQRDGNGNVVIPANSITVFDVTLLTVY